MKLVSNISLNVHVCFPDGTIQKAGRLLAKDLFQNIKTAHFKYEPEYLSDQRAYALDPVNLPLRPGIFTQQDTENGMFNVFLDSLPGSWGAILLASRGEVELAKTRPGHLLAILGTTGMGALGYTPSTQESLNSFSDLSITYGNITAALDEAAIFEQRTWKNEKIIHLRHLLACGSSAGGAQPKVLVKKDGRSWLAKPCGIKEAPATTSPLEYAGMQLAGQAEIPVPPIHLENIGGRQVFFIERFDLTGRNGRNSMISFRSLLGIEDPTVTSYSALANIIQTHSYQPDKDLHQLFRQMVVNVILNNADGHLQNFSMLHTKKGWQLSPAYDIVPNIFQTNQLLAVNQKNAGINVSDLVAEGRNFGLSPITCRQAILDVIEKTSNWQDVFEKSGVPPTKEVKALCEYIKTTWGRIGTVETAKQKNTQGTNVKCQG